MMGGILAASQAQIKILEDKTEGPKMTKPDMTDELDRAKLKASAKTRFANLDATKARMIDESIVRRGK